MSGVRPDREMVRTWLIKSVAVAVGMAPEEIDPTLPFSDFGLTSSQAISMSGELEEWLDRDLSPTLLYTYPTIDSLATALADGATAAVTSGGAPTLTADPAGDDLVAVVGIGCRFPGGADTPARFWDNLLAGTDAARDVPTDRWDADDYYDPDPGASGTAYTRRGAFLGDVAGFDAHFFGIPPAEALRMDPQQRLLLEVTWTALEDAGLAPDGLRGSRTGVFVGMMASQEYGRLQTDRDGSTCLDDPYFGYGLAPSVAAGRLSYVLDLRGPSLCVDTACSSSLLSVHLAAASLRRGECELAVAGGVSAVLHPAAIVQACRSRMLAPDGRCKSFDAAADGYVMGEGCGVVILERLRDAATNGHRILAVVRGSAVGQDGRSNGMTAPSLPAQVQVIRDALAAAGAAPNEVDYVEAHGSGTSLGDAIELTALEEVFGGGRDPQRPLVVGAVKSGLGHLLGAAGIAGLIKTVLALRHRHIPPNVHLDRPNAAVDWQDGEVLLPRQPTEWPDPGRARLAGVSSFGWSGTNVHLLLEEAPPPEPTPAGREWQLLPLSARSGTALARSAAALHDALGDGSGVDLADVAHTLQSGRAALEHRTAIVCRDVDDALVRLREVADGAASTHRVGPGAMAGPVFLFPGTGDQYVGMGRELYRDEPVFRRTVDDCAAILRPILGTDLRDVLYPVGAAPAAIPDLAALLGRRTEQAGPGDELATRTDLAHCAVFSVEYALAQLLQSWGVRPSAVLGYSLGEYVAACVAGVFPLADALRVVAGRARLIGGLPEGAMVAVPLPASAVEAALPAGVSVAATGGPAMTVVAGPLEPIEAFERSLDGRDVAHMRVDTGHPLHTPHLEPVRAEVAELVASAELSDPTVTFVSTATGGEISAELVRDPAYWAAQMCRPIRFDQAVTALGGGPSVLLELGPGQTLTSLATQILADRQRHDVLPVPTLRPASAVGQGGDREHLLAAVARYWMCGGEVEWPRLHDSQPRRTLPLPTYPFEHVRYWPDPLPGADVPQALPARRRGGDRADVADWFSAPVWSSPPVVLPPADPAGTAWLVFTDGSPLADAVTDRLRTRGAEVVSVRPGGAFRQAGPDAYTIEPASGPDHDALFAHLRDVDRFPAHVVHAWSLASAEPDQGWDSGFFSLMHTLRAAGRSSAGRRLQLDVLSSGIHDVLGDEETCPEKATVLGLCRTAEQELPTVRCRSIDVTTADAADPRPGAVADRLMRELCTPTGDRYVAFRGRRRWISSWEKVRIDPAGPGQVWRDGGAYLITGGFGGLGLALARQLAERHRVRLALLGRSPLPERERWDDDAALADDGVRERIAAVRELERLGCEVLPVSADVADPEQLAAAIATVKARFHRIDGVLHAAGVPAGGLLQLKTRSEAETVLRPKVAGTLALHRLLRDEPPDFFAAFSSAVVALGGLGESDYCAANWFLDAFARHARRSGFPMTAVDWGPWRRDSWTTGRSETAALDDRVRQLRQTHGIRDDEGFDALTRALATGVPQLLVAPLDLPALAAWWDEVSAELTSAPVAAHRAYPRPQLRTPYVGPRTDLERQVADVWRRHLGLDRVGVDDQFFELGGTSLVGLGIVAALEKENGISLSAADVFEAPTPASLASLIAARQAGAEAGLVTQRHAGAQSQGRRGEQRRRLAAARRSRAEHRGEQ